MTPEVIAIAFIAGLAGGAVGAVVIGGIQAWMARPKGTPMRHYTRGGGSVTPQIIGGAGPFDRFTDRGKRVLALAQDEAIRHNHNYIGTEHLLAALLRDGDTVAARALTSLGIELGKVRTRPRVHHRPRRSDDIAERDHALAAHEEGDRALDR